MQLSQQIISARTASKVSENTQIDVDKIDCRVRTLEQADKAFRSGPEIAVQALNFKVSLLTHRVEEFDDKSKQQAANADSVLKEIRKLKADLTINVPRPDVPKEISAASHDISPWRSPAVSPRGVDAVAGPEFLERLADLQKEMIHLREQINTKTAELGKASDEHRDEMMQLRVQINTKIGELGKASDEHRDEMMQLSEQISTKIGELGKASDEGHIGIDNISARLRLVEKAHLLKSVGFGSPVQSEHDGTTIMSKLTPGETEAPLSDDLAVLRMELLQTSRKAAADVMAVSQDCNSLRGELAGQMDSLRSKVRECDAQLEELSQMSEENRLGLEARMNEDHADLEHTFEAVTSLRETVAELQKQISEK